MLTKKKRATPKRFRSVALKFTAIHPFLPEAPPKLSVPARESTAWPGAGKMSGKLFEDRNWLLPPNYLSNDNEHMTENETKSTASVTSPRPPIKRKNWRQMIKPQKNVETGPDCPFANHRRKRKRVRHSSKRHHPSQKYKTTGRRPNTLNLNMTKAKQQWEAEMERLN